MAQVPAHCAGRCKGGGRKRPAAGSQNRVEPGRLDEEIQASNIANQKRQDELRGAVVLCAQDAALSHPVASMRAGDRCAFVYRHARIVPTRGDPATATLGKVRLGRLLPMLVVAASLAAAEHAIAQNELIELSAADQRRFAEAILKPKPPSKKLQRAFATHRKLIER